EGSSGQRTEPAVRRAVGVDETHRVRPHEAAERPERPEVGGPAHPHGDGLHPRGLRLGQEAAPRLAGDERSPAVVAEPARLGEDAELLTAEPERCLGVEDRRHGDRLPPPALAGEETGKGGRRYQRPPREPPRPPPAPRRSPPPLPGDFAFSTRIVRPSRFVPFRRRMACSASAGVAISTNPKPRDRPVSRSVTTLADSTAPAAAKASRRRSVEVENERPPTKSLTAMRGAPFWAGRFTANRRSHVPKYTVRERTRAGSSRGAVWSRP